MHVKISQQRPTRPSVPPTSSKGTGTTKNEADGDDRLDQLEAGAHGTWVEAVSEVSHR
jgi:hypothetical protein